MVGRLPAIFMLQNVCSFRLFFITRLTPGYFAEDPAAALASCISIPGCSSTISFITSRIVLPSYTLFFPASKASSNAFRLIKSLPILLLLSPAPQGRNYNRVHGYKIRLVIYYRRCQPPDWLMFYAQYPAALAAPAPFPQTLAAGRFPAPAASSGRFVPPGPAASPASYHPPASVHEAPLCFFFFLSVFS